MITLDRIRAQIRTRPEWRHALRVIDIIEEKAEEDTVYASVVEQWLTDDTCSTIWLRDEVMEPLRHLPEIVEIGKQFNVTTEWHNTWMPIDTAMHWCRIGQRTQPMTAYLAAGIAEGFEEADDEDHVIEAWQYLHSTGLAYKLQGWFGRQAQAMLAEGIISDDVVITPAPQKENT